MLKRALQCCSSALSQSSSRCIETIGRRYASTTLLEPFFDDQENWGKKELRPVKRPGRAWNKNELQLKSNSDLHKLWFVLLKERNMLLTMKKAYEARLAALPNPERLFRVNESMKNLETVVHERNDAYFRLETGVSADRPERTVTSFAGFTYKKPSDEHYLPDDSAKEYEIPYLDDDAHLMQKLWAEKEYWKKRDAQEDREREQRLTKDMRRFRRGGPRVINRLEQMGSNNGF